MISIAVAVSIILIWVYIRTSRTRARVARCESAVVVGAKFVPKSLECQRVHNEAHKITVVEVRGDMVTYYYGNRRHATTSTRSIKSFVDKFAPIM